MVSGGCEMVMLDLRRLSEWRSFDAMQASKSFQDVTNDAAPSR